MRGDADVRFDDDNAREFGRMNEQAEEIFADALEVAPSHRAAFLEKACRGNSELQAEVQALLGDAENADTFFASLTCGAPGAPSAGSPQPADRPNTQIGPYRLIRPLGHGGFGSVWMAEQSGPIRRLVAVKLIKRGMDSEEVLARFRTEQQALALMEHPNIARVFDAGSTADGRPYFVMELVDGERITDFCDRRKLAIPDRVRVFLQICAAVNHAHQKGIIHRDLKPSNILVTLDEDRPVVKVIDFGIAKAVEVRLIDQTLFTRLGQVLGTPVYMSPEQAGLDGLDIDTRSDIYALGVVLYELLVGVPPFDVKTLIHAGHEEMRRIVREVVPPRPSARMTLLNAEKIAALATARSAATGGIQYLIPTDLDWIVMKALEKSRERRYASADAFAEDARRFIDDEPVSARPPGSWYLMGKFMKRHAAALVVTAGIVGVLIVSVAFSSWQAARALKAEALAEARLNEVVGARALESRAKEDAEAVARFFRGIFEMPDPDTKGRDVKIADALDAAAGKIEVEFATQPRRRALFEETLGGTYARLGLYPQAVGSFRKALTSYEAAGEETGRDYLRTLGELTDLLSLLGYYAEAADMGSRHIALLEQESAQSLPLDKAILLRNKNWFSSGRPAEALASQSALLSSLEKALGADHERTRAAKASLLAIGERMGVEKEPAQPAPSPPALQPVERSPQQLNDKEQAQLRDLRNQLEEARLHQGQNSVQALEIQNKLAWSLGMSGSKKEGTSLMKDALDRLVIKYGETHAQVLAAESDWAYFLWRTLQFQAAREAWATTLKKRTAIFGPNHLETLLDQALLADSLFHAGHVEEATKLATDTVDSLRQVAGKTRALHHAMGILSRCCRASGKWRQAMEILEECAPHMPDDTFVNHSLAELQAWFGSQGAYEETRSRMIASTPRIWAQHTNRPDVYERTAILASLTAFKDSNQADDVRSLLNRARELRSTPTAVLTRDNLHFEALARCLVAYRLGDDEGVQSAYEDCLRLIGKREGVSDKPIAADLLQAMSLLRRGKGEEAKKFFHEVITAMPPYPADNEEIPPRRPPNYFPLGSWILQREAQRLFTGSPQ